MTRALGLALVLLAGCGDPPEEGPSDEEIADEIWQDIQGWEGWTQIAPWDGLQPSSDCTHGPYVEITFNDLAADNYGSDDLPDGSIVVKRGHDADDQGQTVSSQKRELRP